MKKLFTFAAALLLAATSSFAQEDYSTRLQIIPRFDANPYFVLNGDGEKEMGWGNSGLYTEFEHYFTDNLNFSMLNLWVNSAPKELYSNTFRSDVGNWLAYCKLSYSFSNFEISVGKDYLTFGGFENDPNDYDFFFESNTPVVSELCSTQWGAQFFWTNNSENTSIGVQVMTSPFGEKPFASGLFSFNAVWRGEYGPLSTIWSVGAIGVEKGRYEPLVSLGQRLSFGNCALTFDWMNSAMVGFGGGLNNGNTFRLEFMAGLASWVDFTAGGYCVAFKKNILDELLEWGREFEDIKSYFGGYGRFEFFPLRNSRNLRLHLSAAYTGIDKGLSLNGGLTYNLDFKW